MGIPVLNIQLRTGWAFSWMSAKIAPRRVPSSPSFSKVELCSLTTLPMPSEAMPKSSTARSLNAVILGMATSMKLCAAEVTASVIRGMYSATLLMASFAYGAKVDTRLIFRSSMAESSRAFAPSQVSVTAAAMSIMAPSEL